jgi:RNA polymerase sigma-70 factor (ECF subfamily)
LSQFQDGSQEAFDQLYAEKSPDLVRLVSWKSGYKLDNAESEGVVQQVFLQVFRKAASYRGTSDGEAWSWIGTIARNHIIDVIRQKEAFEKHQVDLDDETYAGGSVSFDELAMEQKDWLERFLPLLSAREQLVLELLYEGVSHKEIAGRLGVCLPRVTQIKKSIQRKAQRFER